VTVLAVEFRNHRPSSVPAGTKGLDQSSERLILQRGTIDQGDHSIISTPIENFPKPDLERAKLSSLRSSVYNQVPTAPVYDRAKVLGVYTGNYEDELAVVG